MKKFIMINFCRKQLLKFAIWLNKKMQASETFSKHDPEWIATQNEATRVINALKKQIV